MRVEAQELCNRMRKVFDKQRTSSKVCKRTNGQEIWLRLARGYRRILRLSMYSRAKISSPHVHRWFHRRPRMEMLLAKKILEKLKIYSHTFLPYFCLIKMLYFFKK